MAKAKLSDRLDWFPCYPGNLLGAISGMPAEEGYTYVIVLLRIYESWGPCKDTIDALARRTGFTKRKIEVALGSLFSSGRLVQTDAGITSPKADEVMRDQEATVERMRKRASEAGKKSAEKRQQNQPEAPTKDEPKPGTSPAQVNRKVRKEDKRDSPNGESIAPPARASDWPKDYEAQFWGTYPRRTEKKAALAKLEAIKKSGTVPWAVFFAGVMRFAAKCERERIEDRFIKQPTTWLNRGCWDDEIGKGQRPADTRRGGGFSDVLDLLNHQPHEDADASDDN